MPNVQAAKRGNIDKARPRTSSEIIAEQKEQAAREKARAATKAQEPKAMVPAKPVSAAVALPDNRLPVQKYIDEIAPANIVGRMIKFSKEGKFVTADDDEPVEETAEFVTLCDQTLIGWIKFHPEDDVPPDRVQGLLYDGFVMPARDTLGDLDPSHWTEGLSGQPEDPWRHQVCLVLQRTGTIELFTFVTTSLTGRRAAGNLLRHYDRMQRLNPGELPVVRLKPGGFNHRDPRVGWVAVPQFQIVGRAPRDSAAKPDTSVAADLNDEIPL
jgi:hypothetical protein